MRPPSCYLCHRTPQDVPKDGRTHFTLVRFGVAASERARPGPLIAALRRVRHPPNAVWFCDDHVMLAREHEKRPLDEALAAVERRFHGGRES